MRRRSGLLDQLREEGTDCYRLFHGAVEGCPGLTVDRYGALLLVQTWGDTVGIDEIRVLEDEVEQQLRLGLELAWNPRIDGRRADYGVEPGSRTEHVGQELGLRYDVRPRDRSQDPLLFLDLRAGRRRVLAEARGCSVLNLFAYTCGLGVVAAAGGASTVWNVDFSTSVLDIGRANAERNGLGDLPIRYLCEDAVVVSRQLAGLPIKGRAARRRRYTRVEPRTFDLVLLDPPGWSRGPFGAVDLARDYPSVLKPALLATREGGALLITNNLASVDVDTWLSVVQACAVKAGRPVRNIEMIAPESDFPSPDDRSPLKMAWLSL